MTSRAFGVPMSTLLPSFVTDFLLNILSQVQSMRQQRDPVERVKRLLSENGEFS